MKSADKIEHFDFKRKAIKPKWPMFIAKYILSFPDLKIRGASITKRDMDELEGKPYILLINHASYVDMKMMLKATHPYPVNNVMTLERFNTFTLPLMHSIGVIGKRRFTTDVNLVRNIKHCLNDLETVFCLYPEARFSLDGCTSFIPDSLGGLVKLMKVPCAVLSLKGNFVSRPQWNKKTKYTKVEAEMYPIVKAEELATISADEINRRIGEAFVYDDYRWQEENKVVIDHRNRANGLHRLLYKCPSCGAEHQTDSKGDTLWCNSCGKKWRQDEYGRMKALEGDTEFAHIPDWTKWERECVRKEIMDGTYYFEDTVRVKTLPSWKKFYRHGEGKLIQTPAGTRIECTAYGVPTVIEKKPLELYSMHVEYDYRKHGDCVDISTTDDSYWLYPSKRDVVTKLSFATEEIYKLAKEKANFAKRQYETTEA